MQSSSFIKAGVLTLLLVAGFIISWELFLRGKGVDISYDDDESLWACKRGQVYEPIDRATILIGSSRNKYDINLPLWKKLTGEDAIQLACVGSSPLPVLDNLADDKNFSGKVMVDVTEILFFSISLHNSERPTKGLARYKKQTPAQRFSFQVNHLLESVFVFLDKDYFSLNALIDRVKLHNRDGVFVFPDFPWQFDRQTFARQSYMTNVFVTDTVKQNQVRSVWAFLRKVSKEPPLSGEPLDSLLLTVKKDVDKIQSRGGKVLFVRSPSSGPFLAGENMGYPRDKYWDRILQITACSGIHFADYPAIAHFQCPEFSHLKPSDGLIYTENLVDILQKEKGWTFPHKDQAN